MKTVSLYKKITAIIIAGLILIAMIILGDESALPVLTLGDHMDIKAGDKSDGYAIITQEDGFSGIFLEGTSYLLDPGTYRVELYYEATLPGSSIAITSDGRPIAAYELEPGVSTANCDFTLTQSAEKISYMVAFGGQGSLRVDKAVLVPYGRFYKDSEYLSLLVAVLVIISCVLIYIWDKKSYRPDLESWLILGAIGLLASLPYLEKGLGWAIDLCYHLARIEGIKDGLISGAFPVVIYPQALSGNGYLASMYPDAFLYFPAVLRLFGVSMADSFKSLIIFVNIFTAFVTYYCAKKLEAGRGAALMAAFAYSLFPYRLTNIYSRGAVGEFLAMSFMPLVIAGLYCIIRNKGKDWLLLALGMSGLLYTHSLTTALAGCICFCICLVYIKTLITERTSIIGLIKAAALSLLLGLGFLIPFVFYYKNGNLWINSLDAMGDFSTTALHLRDLAAMSFSGDYHVLSLGVPVTLCFVIVAYYLLCKRDSFVMALFLMALALAFMVTEYFPARGLASLVPTLGAALSKLQFLWRLLGPAAILIVLAGAIALTKGESLAPYKKVIIIGICITSVFSVMRFRDENFAYRDDRDYSPGHESKVIGFQRGANTIEYPFEWRPQGTTDQSISLQPAISHDTVELFYYLRGGTASNLAYSAIEPGSFIEIPVIYYPGYYGVDDTGNMIPLTVGTGNRIRIPLNPDGCEHSVIVDFKPAPHMYLGWLISGLTLIALILIKTGVIQSLAGKIKKPDSVD